MGLKYEPGLDGMRGLAAVAVLFFHTNVPGFERGGAGVAVFFVLSGYLITSLLVQEARRGPIDFGGFYVRRVRRLVPALLAVIVATLILGPVLIPWHTSIMWANAFLAATYTMNFALSAGYPINPLSHTWSLAAEMQFYLLWPFAIPLLLRLRHPALALLAAWAGFAIFNRAFGFVGYPITSYFPLFQISSLLIGAAVAFLPPPPKRPAFAAAGVAALLVGVFAPAVLAVALIQSLPLVEIGTALLISGLASPSPVSRALSWEPLRRLGLVSYGVYLWHFPVLLTMRGLQWEVRAPITLALSIALATISFLTVERWARARRNKPAKVLPDPAG